MRYLCTSKNKKRNTVYYANYTTISKKRQAEYKE